MHTMEPVPHVTTLHQDMSAYTPGDHDVWRILSERRLAAVRSTASDVYLRGSEAIGLTTERVPDLADVNRRLAARTGWSAVGVSGFLPAREFFASLAQRRFPTTLRVRPREELDYTSAPDIFHDVFGHVPLHADPVFAAFLQRFGAAAARATTDEQTTAMARLFWFTVEFGLVEERGATRIYGSGLISSAADAANALGATCERRPFDLDGVLAQSFDIDHVQQLLFVVHDFAQLFDAVERAEQLLGLRE